MHAPPRIPTVVLGLSIAMGLAAAPASATFPGKNGRIAYKGYLDSARTRSAIFTIDAAGRHAHQVSHPPEAAQDTQPDWSRDGKRIAFQRCSGLCETWVVGADGSGETRLGPDCLGKLPSECEYRVAPAFSPSGQIGFGRGSGAFDGGTWEHSDLDLMNADGSNLTTLFSAPAFSVSEVNFAWSPDGKRVVVGLGNSSKSSTPNTWAVYVENSDGTDQKQVTPFRMRAGDGPDWSPNGKRILFRSRADSVSAVGAQVYTANPDGSGRKRISSFKKGTTVYSSSYSPDGKWIVVGLAGPGALPDLWTMHTDGTHLRRITRTKVWESAPDWGSATA